MYNERTLDNSIRVDMPLESVNQIDKFGFKAV